MLRNALGKILKSLRLKKALSQEELAHRATIHVTYVSLLERGKKSPTVDTLALICDALEIQRAGPVLGNYPAARCASGCKLGLSLFSIFFLNSLIFPSKIL